jgi:hypothetical protein
VTKGLRIALWILSSLAVLWTVIALVGWVTMGCCGMMGHGGMMRGMRDGGMMMQGGWMAGMMLHMMVTWLVMLGLVGLFIYLVITARRMA